MLRLMAMIRLYLDHPLGDGQSVALSRDHANYLFNVMRLSVGDRVLVFNGRDGEFAAEVVHAAKRNGILMIGAQTKPLQAPPDLWLLFAPIKKARTDFIVEKATEMGAARILPVLTEFTNSDRLRQDKLQAHVIEAAEQCGATFVPEVAQLHKLGNVLSNWSDDRQILFCDEGLAGDALALDVPRGGKWAILIGPEGGFSEVERERLINLPFVHRIGLGPRILRADTAAVAAMTIWQSTLGDW